MNGVHDMGGMHCFGPVVQELNEPVFHADWERRAAAMTLALGTSGLWNIDMARATREALPAHVYLSAPYYQIWLDALEELLVERGAVTAEEIACGQSLAPPLETVRRLEAAQVAPLFSRGWPSHRPPLAPARFAAGDEVRTVVNSPVGHTRLPRYCRDKKCRIVAVRGAHVFPDRNALSAGEAQEWLYTARFEARDLFGADTSASVIYVDCFESYLSPDSSSLRT